MSVDLYTNLIALLDNVDFAAQIEADMVLINSDRTHAFDRVSTLSILRFFSVVCGCDLPEHREGLQLWTPNTQTDELEATYALQPNALMW